jgi:hypothetical protein
MSYLFLLFSRQLAVTIRSIGTGRRSIATRRRSTVCTALSAITISTTLARLLSLRLNTLWCIAEELVPAYVGAHSVARGSSSKTTIASRALSTRAVTLTTIAVISVSGLRAVAAALGTEAARSLSIASAWTGYSGSLFLSVGGVAIAGAGVRRWWCGVGVFGCGCSIWVLSGCWAALLLFAAKERGAGAFLVGVLVLLPA